MDVPEKSPKRAFIYDSRIPPVFSIEILPRVFHFAVGGSVMRKISADCSVKAIRDKGFVAGPCNTLP
jgi:hypothetical protein